MGPDGLTWAKNELRSLTNHEFRVVTKTNNGKVYLTCGLSLMLVLFVAPRVFLWVFQFPSLLKSKHSKFQWREWKQEPPRGMSTAKIPLFIIVIILPLLLLLLVLILTKRFAKCYLSLRHPLPKQETLFLLSFSSHFVKCSWWEKTSL